MDLKLKGKTALVTGSTAGIGFAVAKALEVQRARVYVNGRTQERVDAAVIGPTPGTVLSRFSRSARSGSRSSELTRA